MGENVAKVEFALGGQVSPGNYFKSSFARSFVSSCREAKSLNLEFMDNGTITEERSDSDNFNINDNKNNNFCSLINFATPIDNGNSSGPQSSTWQTFNEPHSTVEDNGEMDKLRKQCQQLKDENRRLADSLQANQEPRVQMIDNVLLQTQIETLQWQLKQTEANRQMYRSLMGQVVRFLERAKKSLDSIHEKNNPKGKSSKVPRSRSAHAVDKEVAPDAAGRGDVASKSSSNGTNGGSSKFARAKSVAQIAPASSGSTSFRDFTWSVLRRNDPTRSTPPRAKNPAQGLRDLNQTHEGVVYRKPKQPAEIDPDTVPPEKLSQEAFRLMRTVKSLMGMREPDLARLSSSDEPMSLSPPDNDSSSLRSNNFGNSTIINDAVSYNGGCSSSDRGSVGSGADSDNRPAFVKSSSSVMDSSMSSSSTLRSMLPGARRSVDVNSFKSCRDSDEMVILNDDNDDLRRHSTISTTSAASRKTSMFAARETCSTSTPNRRAGKKFEKKHESSRVSKGKPKLANSASSAEDESGFSSMSSFQEVGLPIPFASPISPIKGCQTEIGLPNMPVEKVRHRRWSSTPIEIRSIFKRHSGHFPNVTTNPESLSVWV